MMIELASENRLFGRRGTPCVTRAASKFLILTLTRFARRLSQHDDVEFGRGARRTNRRTSGMSNRRLSNASAISKGSAALNASLVADIGASGLRLMSSDVDR